MKGQGPVRRRATSPTKIETKFFPADLFVMQIHSLTLKQKVQEYMELRKAKKQNQSQRRESTIKRSVTLKQNPSDSVTEQEGRMSRQMALLMQMVTDNSQLNLATGFLMNTLNN